MREALGVFTAFAGVGFTANAVHGDCQCRVRFPADRAIAHCAGRKTLHDGAGRFDFGQVEWHVRLLQRHQPTDGQKAFALFVDRTGELFIILRVLPAHGMLELGDAGRRPGMVFTTHAVTIDAADIEHVAVNRVVGISRRVTAHCFLSDFIQTNAFNGRCGAGEILLNEGGGEANRIKDLRAAIRLIGGDAHLGHDLQDALADRLDEVLLNLIAGQG